MNLFNRGKNERITLGEAATDNQTTAHSFTAEQWEAVTAALDLAGNVSIDEVIAAVTALTEAKAEAANDEQIAASGEQIAAPVVIDAAVWQDMQRTLKVGVTAEKQRHRLAAEQVVDQAVRLGKASAAQREHWIAAYGQDPDATIHALNRGEEIPRMEIGYGIDPEAVEGSMPTGWVR